ncbi:MULTISPECIES: hypothetical protein [unclassified Paenibacillus]|uniref:hypothetical protein n=1 Tax=unclassified Paenibacillus TaxID=185978 RepID=UPI0012691616|nr:MULTISPECIES: hypothetical protein [unclassified Paenibacillus]
MSIGWIVGSSLATLVLLAGIISLFISIRKSKNHRRWPWWLIGFWSSRVGQCSDQLSRNIDTMGNLRKKKTIAQSVTLSATAADCLSIL